MHRDTTFGLLVLERAEDFVFSYFPTTIETSARANWQAQDTTISMKPLFYANREPRRIRIDNLLLDSSQEEDGTIETEIRGLYRLLDEVQGQGKPPLLLAQWGERTERCVLEDVTVVETLFRPDGVPIRASVSLTLLQFQDDDAPPSVSRRESRTGRISDLGGGG